MHELHLSGCRLEPLGSYLKAVGILRLVSAQIDRSAQGWWDRDHFVLRSQLDLDDLVEYLRAQYRPTPLVAPWNNGSGFGPEDARKSPTAVQAVEQLASSDDPRLAEYREAISIVRRLTADPGWAELPKAEKVVRCRNALPDSSVEWLDAAVVLAGDRLDFPPLLGTGGNDGRLDFSSNFMQRLPFCLGLAGASHARTSRELAEAALTGRSVPLQPVKLGMFDPGAAGGVGSSPLGAADALASPWDFVLAFEGALVFASAAARRLSFGRAVTAAPFMVDAAPVGHPSAANASGRGELWAPVWSRPATAQEIERLVGEGRVEFGGRPARSGLDVACAVATLGVDRGIDEFVRHAIVERNGRTMFAVPVGRLVVREQPRVSLTTELERWVQSVRLSGSTSGAMERSLRAFDEALFALATAESGREELLGVLAAAAEVEQLTLRSRSTSKVQPFRLPGAGPWVEALDDGSPEFAVATAVAATRSTSGQATSLVRELTCDLTGANRPPEVPGLGVRPIVDVLADVHLRLAVRYPPSSISTDGDRCWLASIHRERAPLPAVLALASSSLDEAKLSQVLRALLVLDWRNWRPAVPADRTPGNESQPLHHPRSNRDVAVGRAYALLALPFHSGCLPGPYRLSERPVARQSWIRLLQAGHVRQVLEEASRVLRIAGVPPLFADVGALARTVHNAGPHLAAALLVATRPNELARLLRSVLTPPDSPSTQEMINS